MSIFSIFKPFISQRFWLAGPITLILSVFMMAAMTLWFPQGQAKINHLAIPLILFPLFWAALFFYVNLETSLKRAWIVMLLLLLANGLPVVASIMGWLS